jgi:hypothetical protein
MLFEVAVRSFAFMPVQLPHNLWCVVDAGGQGYAGPGGRVNVPYCWLLSYVESRGM